MLNDAIKMDAKKTEYEEVNLIKSCIRIIYKNKCLYPKCNDKLL